MQLILQNILKHECNPKHDDSVHSIPHWHLNQSQTTLGMTFASRETLLQTCNFSSSGASIRVHDVHTGWGREVIQKQMKKRSLNFVYISSVSQWRQGGGGQARGSKSDFFADIMYRSPLPCQPKWLCERERWKIELSQRAAHPNWAKPQTNFPRRQRS